MNDTTASTNNLTTYKGYTIETCGISRYIYRPNEASAHYAPGYAQSMAAAKRWINADIQNRGAK